MVILFISMLKITILLTKLTLKWLGVNDSKVDKFDIDSGEKIAKKLEKLKNQNYLSFKN